MSHESYIYASSRIAALEAGLLSESQMERMISAKSADEAFGALHDTFLAPYIAGVKKENLSRALRKSVSATKKLITDIAPDKELFEVLWLYYDFYNLSTIVKGLKVGLSQEELMERCFFAGVHMPDKVIDAVKSENVAHLHPELARAFRAMHDVEHSYDIDHVANMAYLRVVADVAEHGTEEFVRMYATKVIDFFNLETQLRLVLHPSDLDRTALFAPGGSYRLEDLPDRQAIIERYRKQDYGAMWEEALASFEEMGDYAVLEKAVDEYMVRFVKEHNTSILSPVPLFAYFLAHRNNTQIIKTIMVAQESGMPQTDLRRILRRLYA